MKRKIFDAQFIRFLGVGVINTAVGTGTMFLLYNVFGAGYWISSASNYIVGSIVSYILNKKFTFKNQDSNKKTIIKFIVGIAVCYGIAYGIAKPLVHTLLSGQSQTVADNVAMLVGMGLFVIINYLSQKFRVQEKPSFFNWATKIAHENSGRVR